MCSYLVSCAISQQSLQEEESVKIVLLANAPLSHPATPILLRKRDGSLLSAQARSHHAPFVTDDWHPYSLALNATVEDCGEVTLELETATDKKKALITLAGLTETAFDVDKDDGNDRLGAFSLRTEVDKYPKINYAITLLNDPSVHQSPELDDAISAVNQYEINNIYNSVFEMLREGRLFVANPFSPESPMALGASLIHASSFELTKQIFSETSWLGALHTQSNLLTHAVLDNDDKARIDFGFIDDEKQRESIEHQTLASGLWIALCSRLQLNAAVFPSWPIGAFLPLKETDSSDNWDALLEPVLSDMHLFQAMSEMHIPFAPSRYMGQDYANEKGVLFAKLVAASQDELTPTEEDNEEYNPYPSYPHG